MRLISQDGLVDVYYGDVRLELTIHPTSEVSIYARTDCWYALMGEYGSYEEACQVMNDLRGWDDLYYTFPKQTPKACDYDQSIDTLELSVRSYNILKRAGFNTISQLAKENCNSLMGLRNMGRKSLEEISARLREVGAWK